MSWETTSVSLDGSSPTMITTTNENDLRQEENEQKRLVQLQNFQRDHKTKEIKSIYHAVMSQFGQMFTENNQKGIVQTILVDDCEIFLFNFAETVPVQYAFRSEGFATLFEDKRVIRREVRETYVSLKKTTGFEICECEVIDETKGSSMSQFSFEIFSFKGEKISKMRLSYGSMPMSYNPSSLFTPTKKERMLAKVKELNYAWADQPDLERIASLMHENTEYKFWSWQDKKCFIFDKNNFVLEFKKSLEEDFIITSVVPYGISSEAQYLYGSYVYHLEGKHNLTGQKFIWVSTCIYTFDQDCNIKKMSQQGELHPEGEILIPFQATSMKTLVKHPESRHNNGVSIFDSDWMTFSSDLMIFGADDIYFTGHIKGLSQFGILEKVISNRRQNTEKPRHIDIFDDIDDPCYDGAIVIGSSKGTLNREGHPFHGKPISIYSAGKLSFENGKIAKVLVFPCEILEPIPSPFDDVSFSELNFRPKSEFL